MPINFKAPLSSATANNTFLDKTIDDTTIGKITMNNGNSTLIDDPQNYINELADVDGVLSEGDATAKDYSSNNFINDGDNRKVAIGKLDAQVKVNRDDIDSNDTDISALDGRVTTIEGDYGQPNGLATLDGTGKLPASQLTLSAMEFKGNWDANTNTPTLADGVGSDGDTYRVNVAGSQDLGSGSISFDIGDWIYYSGLVWFKGDNVDQVISVNSQQGAVVLDADDIAETTRFWDIKHNNNAVVDPTVNEDSGDGYTVGSTWFNSLLGKKFTLQDATIGAAVWIETSGGGTGDGSFNYITNGNAETDTTGWTVYANTTPGTSPDDFGGTPNVGFTWTRNTTTPLIFTGDFKLTKPSGVNTQGHGAYFEFTSENGHAATMMLNSLLANTSAFDDNDLSIWLVGSNDNFVSNFTLISAANPDVLAGIPTIYKQFQLDAEQGIKYRYCIHNNVTDTTLKEAYFDEIKLGPSPVATSAVVTDMKAYTPGLSGLTTSSLDVSYKQLGDELFVVGTITTSNAPATTAKIQLPLNLVMDDSIVDYTVVGKATRKVASPDNNDFRLHRHPGDSTFVYVSPVNNSSNSVMDAYNWNTLTGSAQVISFDFKVKIKGWSSNAASSIDLGNREIAVVGRGNATEVITASVTDIPFVEISDSTGSWNGSKLIVPETGYYPIEGFVHSSAAVAAGIYAYLDGTIDDLLGYIGGATTNITKFSGKIYALAGQELSLRSDTGITLVNSGLHRVTITKDASPQTMLEAPTVAARYTSNSGQVVANNANVIYEDFVTDLSGSYDSTTGVYTASRSGWATVIASIRINANLSAAFSISHQSTQIAKGFNASSTDDVINVVAGFQIFKDQTIEIKNVTGATRTLSTDSSDNTFSVRIE